MTTDETIEQHTNSYAKIFLLGSLAMAVVTGLTYYTQWLVAFRVIVAYLIPIALIISMGLSVALYREGNGTLPLWPLVAGIVSVVGGASFDIIATLIKAPSLESEANPIARALFDSGHSTEFVYVYGLIAQILVIVVGCSMWTAFLRHQKTIITLSKNTAPKSYWEFLKAATGSGHLSWRQYFFPRNLSEMPKSYYVVWLVAVGWVGVSVYRWYLGLEWLDLAHGLRIQVLVGSVLLSFAAYMLWLWVKYSKYAEQERRRANKRVQSDAASRPVSGRKSVM